MLVKINDDGTKVYVSFHHVTQGPDKRTICIITQTNVGDEGETILASGVARCSQKDLYSKETGRLLSMTRALSSFVKSFRAQIWEAYWHRGQNAEAEFVAAYVPDAENYSAAEAQQIAERRDETAAQNLLASVQGTM